MKPGDLVTSRYKTIKLQLFDGWEPRAFVVHKMTPGEVGLVCSVVDITDEFGCTRTELLVLSGHGFGWRNSDRFMNVGTVASTLLIKAKRDC